MKPDAAATTPPVPLNAGISEVRYSLPALIREVQLERAAAVFSMEKLDRTEISKIFHQKRSRRALKNSQ